MDEKELQKLYQAMSQQFDVGDYNTFRSKMQTTDDRKRFYDAVGQNGFDIGDYNEYEKRIAGQKKNSSWVEKMVAGGIGSKAGGVLGTSAAQSQKEISPQAALDYLKRENTTTPEVKKEVQVVSDDPIGDALRPIKERQSEIKKLTQGVESTGQGRMYGQGIGDEVGNLRAQENQLLSEKFSHSNEAKQFLEKILDPSKLKTKTQKQFPEAYTFDDYTEESIKDAVKFNATGNIAANQYFENKKVRDAISGNATLEDAAIDLAVNKGDKTADQITALGGQIPRSMKGSLLVQLISNENLPEIVRDNPELATKLKFEIERFPTQYPEAAVTVLATMISNEREKRGENNAFINLPGKKVSDKIVDDLVESGELSESYKKFYEDNKLLVNGVLKTPGIVENTLSSLDNTVHNIGKSLAEVTNIRDLYKSNQEKQFGQLQSDYQQINFKPKGLLHKITTHGGEMLGQVVPTIAGGGILRGANIIKNPAAATALMTGLQTYGYNLDRARVDLPKASEGTQTALGLLYTGGEMAFSNLLNDVKLANQVMSAVRPGIKNVITKFDAGEITKAAAKEGVENIYKTALNGLSKFGKSTLKVADLQAREEVATNLFQNSVKQAFDGTPIPLKKQLEESFDIYTTSFLGSLPIGIGGGVATISNNDGVASMVYDMASNPEKYIDVMKGEAAINPEYAKDIDQKLDNLQYVVDVKKELDGRDMKEDAKAKFLIKSLSEKMLKEKTKAVPDKSLNKEAEKKLAELEIEKEDIINPMSNTELATRLYEKDLIPKHDRFLVENQETGKFDETKVGQYLKYIAQQANGLGENWEVHADDAPDMKNYPAKLIEIANERWRKEIDKANESVTKIGIDEISKPIELDPNLPEGYKLPEQVKQEFEVTQPELPQNEIIQDNTEVVEPISTEETVITETEPTETGEGTIPETAEGEKINLTHAGTEKIYEESGLPLRAETPTKHREQLEKEAEEKLQKGYDFDKVAEETMTGDRKWEDTDQLLFERKVADLKAKQKGLDVLSPEFNQLQNQIERYSRASDVAGTIGGRFLQSRKNAVPVEETISDSLILEKELTGSPELTDQQKETVAKEFTEISETEKALAAKMEQLIEENNRLKAEAAVKNAGKSVKKGEKKDFKKEREVIFKSIKEKLEKARQDTQATFVPYAKELIAIAPDVAKLMKSYIEQGVTELSEIVKKIHSDIGDEKITERDVRDILAGEYNEKKRTRNQLAEQAFNLKREAKLLNQLEDLLKGEIPVSDARKQKKIKAIEDLKNQIKDIRSIDRDAKAEKDAIVEAASSRQKEIAKKLDKAEKEIDSAEAKAAKEKAELEEKERKQKMAEAEKERKRLEREFDKEKRAEEKAKAKAALDEARRLEKELSFRTPEEKRLDSYKNRVNKEAAEVKDKLDKGDYSIPEKKEPLKLDKEARDLRDNLIRLKRQQDARRLMEKRKNETGTQKGMRLAAEVLNIPRTLMTIGDFSGLLRQNIFFSAGHPLRTAKAVPGMFKSFTSQKVYDRWFQDYKESPVYDIAEKSKLAIADSLSHDLSKREEDFMSTLAEKIPVVGRTLRTKDGKPIIPGLNIVKGSERSYTMLLNKARVDAFTSFVKDLEARGITYENSPKVYKAVAEYVNNATGRSDFGKTLNKVAPLLNSAFFSPRLIASRINMLTYWMQPRFWKTLPKEVRIDYMRNWLSLLGTGMTILALAKAGGAEVEDDPRSSDFGKIKSGNTRWDIWGGSQQYMRVLAQVASGKRKSTNTGNIYDLSGDDIFGKTRADVVKDFFRGKLAPVPAAAVDLLSGRTGIGDKIMWQWGGDTGDKEITLDQYVKERLLPMTITGTEEAMKDQGVKALFTVGIPNIFGIGTSTYKAPENDSSRERPKREPRVKRERAERE